MTGLTMFDSVSLDQIPADAQFLAAYVDGRFANVAEARDRFPHARILSIAVFAAHDADALDIESGDATPGQAVAWYERQKARGVTRPCLYASASVMQSDVVGVLMAAKIPRSSVRLWSAHYTGVPHICSASSCGLTSIEMDGTQFTDNALGRNLDESLLAADFFGTPPSPVPAWQEALMNTLPTLNPGAEDKPGHVFYVHRMQALVSVIGQVKDIASAACLETTGVFDTATVTALKAVQGSFGLTQDAICGPKTWAALVTGQHG